MSYFNCIILVFYILEGGKIFKKDPLGNLSPHTSFIRALCELKIRSLLLHIWDCLIFRAPVGAKQSASGLKVMMKSKVCLPNKSHCREEKTITHLLNVYYEGRRLFTPIPAWGHLWSKLWPCFFLNFADEHF